MCRVFARRRAQPFGSKFRQSVSVLHPRDLLDRLDRMSLLENLGHAHLFVVHKPRHICLKEIAARRARLDKSETSFKRQRSDTEQARRAPERLGASAARAIEPSA